MLSAFIPIPLLFKMNRSYNKCEVFYWQRDPVSTRHSSVLLLSCGLWNQTATDQAHHALTDRDSWDSYVAMGRKPPGRNLKSLSICSMILGLRHCLMQPCARCLFSGCVPWASDTSANALLYLKNCYKSNTTALSSGYSIYPIKHAWVYSSGTHSQSIE